MKNRIFIVAIIAAVTGFLGVAFGVVPEKTIPDKNLETSPTSTIVLGHNIDEALQIFKDQEIAHGRAAFSFARMREDEDYVTANIDPAHMTLCLWYSKTNREIIRMQVLVTPWPYKGKVFDNWLPVTSYQLNEDGTFVLSFPKPLAISEIEEGRKKMMEKKAEFPPANFGESNFDK